MQECSLVFYLHIYVDRIVFNFNNPCAFVEAASGGSSPAVIQYSPAGTSSNVGTPTIRVLAQPSSVIAAGVKRKLDETDGSSGGS